MDSVGSPNSRSRYFEKEAGAARAYDQAVVEEFKEYAEA